MILTISIITLLTVFAKAQEASVERSIYGAQAGLLGIWVQNETRLSKEVALRSEIGFNSGLFGGTSYEKTGFIMTPVITIEPRWYYNLEKRLSKSRNTNSNSGNFLGIKTSYHPDLFVFSNYDNLSVLNQVSLIPKWGIRRVMGTHLSFETGFGIGYMYIFAKSAGYLENEDGLAVDLHLRIGYNF